MSNSQILRSIDFYEARSWTLSVDELREWLHIDDGELVKVNGGAFQGRVILAAAGSHRKRDPMNTIPTAIRFR
jgi:hypothetical protein